MGGRCSAEFPEPGVCSLVQRAASKGTNERGAVPRGTARRSDASASEDATDSDSETAVGSQTENAPTPRRPKDFENVLGRFARDFEPRGPSEASPQASPATEGLFRAARTGDYEGVLSALASGASVGATTLRGQTPLMLAAATRGQGGLQCLQLLLDVRADIEAKDRYGWTPLLYGCRNDCEKQVEKLLDLRAQLKVSTHDGRTAIMLATLEGSRQLVEKLFARKAQLNKKDEQGWTPLFHACSRGSVDLVRWLLKHGGDAQDVANGNKSALMMSIGVRNDTKIASQLVRRSCSVNAQNDVGDTAMMIALREDQLHFARWLLTDPHTDVLLRNLAGEDAIDICEARGLQGMRMQLESKARHQAELQAEKEKSAAKLMESVMGRE